MAEMSKRRGPLAHWDGGVHRGDGVDLSIMPDRPLSILRGEAADALFDVVRRTLGLDLPTVPNTAAAGTDATILWLAPDEWLIVASPDAASDLPPALDACHAAVMDMSDALCVIRIAGERARDALAQGCSLDLHPRAFPGVARTRLAKADVLLHAVDGSAAPAFDIYVARSYADYLWRWLIASG